MSSSATVYGSLRYLALGGICFRDTSVVLWHGKISYIRLPVNIIFIRKLIGSTGCKGKVNGST